MLKSQPNRLGHASAVGLSPGLAGRASACQKPLGEILLQNFPLRHDRQFQLCSELSLLLTRIGAVRYSKCIVIAVVNFFEQIDLPAPVYNDNTSFI